MSAARRRRPYSFRGRHLTRLDLAQRVEQHPDLRDLREALRGRMGSEAAQQQVESLLARALDELGEEMLAEAGRDIDAVLRTWSRLADAYRSAGDRAEMGRIAVELSELPGRLEERVRLLPDGAGMIADAVPDGMIARLRYPVAAGRLTPEQLQALGARLKEAMPRAIALELQRMDGLDRRVHEAVAPLLAGLRLPVEQTRPAARTSEERAPARPAPPLEALGRGCLRFVRLWPCPSPPSPAHLAQGVEGLAIAPDGRVALWGPWEPCVRSLILPVSERKLAPEDGRAWWRHCLAAAISPDGRWGAAGGAALSVWDLGSGRLLVDLEPQAEAELHALAFSPDGRRLAAVGADAELVVYDLARGEADWRVPLGEAALAVAWSPDGLRVHAGGWAGVLTVHRADNGGRITAFDELGGSLNGLALDGSGRLLVTAAGSGCMGEVGLDPCEVPLRVWDAHSGAVVRDLRDMDVPAIQVAVEGRRLVTIGDDGSLRVFDLDSGTLLARVELAEAQALPSALAVGGGRVLVGTEEGAVYEFELLDERGARP